MVPFKGAMYFMNIKWQAKNNPNTSQPARANFDSRDDSPMHCDDDEDLDPNALLMMRMIQN